MVQWEIAHMAIGYGHIITFSDRWARRTVFSHWQSSSCERMVPGWIFRTESMRIVRGSERKRGHTELDAGLVELLMCVLVSIPVDFMLQILSQ